MNSNQVTKSAVSSMDLAAANSALTVNGITAVQRQMVQTRIKSLTAPVEAVQEQLAQDTVTAPEPTPTVVVKVEKNKPFQTTRTIEKFKDDTKGIRAGSQVSFLENNKPGAKVIIGTVQRVFDFWAKPERQEVKIKGNDGNRYYRFETGVQPIIAPVPAPANVEGDGI